jgi:RNA polymerase primary sigma factor
MPKKPVIKAKKSPVKNSKLSNKRAPKNQEPAVNVELSEKDLNKIVTKGKKQGYLTLDEILELFPQAEEKLEILDLLYEKLGEAGVNVLI